MSITNKHKIILTILLVVTIVLFTTYYYYPWHPDHYTLGQYTYATIEKGYVPWILHPASLFGYYPLSVSSGFEFFFASLYTLTGIDLPILFYFFSIFSALFAVAGVYLVMREFSSFETSFITAFILATMVYFVKNLSNTGSSRMFNLIFYPLFILVLFRIYKIYKQENKISLKYGFIEILLFTLMNLIHRFGQLLIIFILAFILAILLAEFKNIVKWFKSTRLYNLKKKYYEHSILIGYIDLLLICIIGISFFLLKNKIAWIIFVIIAMLYYVFFDNIKALNRPEKFLILDICLFIIYGISAKVIELLLRGRLQINLSRLLEKYSFQLIVFTAIMNIIIIIAIVLIIRKFKNLKNFYNFVSNEINNFIKNPKILTSWILLLITLFLVSKNFTGDNFYTFGLEHYTNSYLLHGNSPWVIMINFIFNLNNNLTILIYFAGIGAIYLFLKKDKSFYDYFFIFVGMGFSQFLLDWEYIRLYMLPIYAIFIGIGLTFVLKKLSLRFSKNTLLVALIMLFTVHFVVGNIFIQREVILKNFDEVQFSTIPEPYFMAAGNYIKDKGDISIYTSSSNEYDGKTAYYAQKVNSVIAEITFPHGKELEIEQLSFQELLDDFNKGKKISQIYNLKDPLFDGYYYFGRYTNNLNIKEINNKDSKKIIDLYNISYMIDSPNSEKKTIFFESAQPIKNKVYSSGELDIYDLSEGR